MDRRTFLTAASAFALRPSLHAQSRVEDINAIYTLVLSAEAPTAKSKWYIEALTYSPEVPSIATREYTPLERAEHVSGSYPNIHPPADRMADAAEIIADFKLRLTSPFPIDSHLPLPHPYQLLSSEKVRLYNQINLFQPIDKSADKSVPSHLSAKQRRELESIPAITSLAPIGFNRDQTLALTATRWFHGNTFTKRPGGIAVGGAKSAENWYVLEKRNSLWRKTTWHTSGYFSQA